MRRLRELHARLRECDACPRMIGPVIVGRPVRSRIFLIGQAPGPREGALGRPFAWTAGRTMFGWFAGLGVEEERFRQRVHIAAVCRCFPGKTAAGGDRVPDRAEIERCGQWMAREVALQRPELVLPVGRLAIGEVLGRATRLEECVGRVKPGRLHGTAVDVLALPHPSGLSSWWKVEPGRALLARALLTLGRHPVWTGTFDP